METEMTHETHREICRTIDAIEANLAEDYLNGVSLEARLEPMRVSAVQYCVANHLV